MHFKCRILQCWKNRWRNSKEDIFVYNFVFAKEAGTQAALREFTKGGSVNLEVVVGNSYILAQAAGLVVQKHFVIEEIPVFWKVNIPIVTMQQLCRWWE